MAFSSLFIFIFISIIFANCLSSLSLPLHQGQQANALIAWQRKGSNASQHTNAEGFICGIIDATANNECYYDSNSDRTMEEDLIQDGLPGQMFDVMFKQYAGYINVAASRNLFYYFVEADVPNPSTKPLVLWLNGGPGCSSVGIGAMLEIGPFGVNKDGKTLYSRQYAWNKAANILFLESPAGVGFSYSNDSSDYYQINDTITAIDNYNFLINWFKRYSHYLGRDFYIAGENYAGYYIPELAYIIQKSTSTIRLKGIMIGNGVMNYATDFKGIYDYMWSHSLISDETQQEKKPDPCEPLYVQRYLNIPEVQAVLNANTTKLPYLWTACSPLLKWPGAPKGVIPLYQELMKSDLKIFLYGGEADSVVPIIGIRYGLRLLNLTVSKPWYSWLDYDNNQTAGYRVDYDGLSFATVLGAGHQVATDSPHRAFALFRHFLMDNF